MFSAIFSIFSPAVRLYFVIAEFHFLKERLFLFNLTHAVELSQVFGIHFSAHLTRIMNLEFMGCCTLLTHFKLS